MSVIPIRTSPEQRYRVVVTNEARVSTHIHLMSNRTRPEVVEHVLEHFIRNGEAGDVVEVQGFGGYELKLAVDTCSQCGGLGWLHEVSGAGDVVLACGHWGTFNHEHARVKHDGDCGCAWGAVGVALAEAAAGECVSVEVTAFGVASSIGIARAPAVSYDLRVIGAGVVSSWCAQAGGCSACVAEACSCPCHRAAALKRLPAVPLEPPTTRDLRAREEEDRANARTEDRDDDDLPRFGDDR